MQSITSLSDYARLSHTDRAKESNNKYLPASIDPRSGDPVSQSVDSTSLSQELLNRINSLFSVDPYQVSYDQRFKAALEAAKQKEWTHVDPKDKEKWPTYHVLKLHFSSIETLPTADSAELALKLENFGNFETRMGNYPEAVRLLEKVVSIRQKELGAPSNAHLQRALNRLAHVSALQGNHAKSKEITQEALRTREKFRASDNDPETLFSQINLGFTSIALNDPDEYTQKLDSRIETLLKSQPKENPLIDQDPDSQFKLGDTCYLINRYENAMICYEKALRLYAKIKSHDRITKTWIALGDVWFALGQDRTYGSAILCYINALRHYDEHFPMGNDRDIAKTLIQLAKLKVVVNYPEGTIELVKRALKMNEQLNPSGDHLDIANSLYHLGTLYLSIGETREGCESLKRALTIYNKLPPPLRQTHQYCDLPRLYGIYILWFKRLG